MANGNHPYVVYKIEAVINDRGIGFTIKSAIQSFLDRQGITGKVTNFDASSDAFSATLELMGGKCRLQRTSTSRILRKERTVALH